MYTGNFIKPTDSIYFRSGQDCASEHRVHKRVHPPGGHGDDGRQPSMDSSCGFKGHLDHLKHPPLGVAHSPTISKHDLAILPSPPTKMLKPQVKPDICNFSGVNQLKNSIFVKLALSYCQHCVIKVPINTWIQQDMFHACVSHVSLVYRLQSGSRS